MAFSGGAASMYCCIGRLPTTHTQSNIVMVPAWRRHSTGVVGSRLYVEVLVECASPTQAPWGTKQAWSLPHDQASYVHRGAPGRGSTSPDTPPPAAMDGTCSIAFGIYKKNAAGRKVLEGYLSRIPKLYISYLQAPAFSLLIKIRVSPL